MAITSQERQPLAFAEALVADWQAAGLIKPSVLKPVFTTIEQGLLVRTMGKLSDGDLRALRELIAQVIDLHAQKRPRLRPFNLAAIR